MTATKSAGDLENSLDAILEKIGDFGKYQVFIFSLVCFVVVLHSSTHNAYVFTALNVDYRCEIPGCDLESCNSEYAPSWLENAVPFTNNKPLTCNMYSPFSNETGLANNCSIGDFNTLITERCSSFVYKTEERSILQEYNLQCDNNRWKLTMVGTINNIGQFIGLFVSGIASDKFGRKPILIWGMVFSAVCGIIRAFMPTYELFLVFELLDAAFSAGTYICGFLVGVELVGPGKRVLTGVISNACYTIGEVFIAGVAWLVQDWKKLIFIAYSPIFLLISYPWIIPESIRWELSKGNVNNAKRTLRKVAKINGKEITDKDLEKLDKLAINCEESEKSKSSFAEALKSTTLMLRLINCCFCWITCTFLFYGLTLNSVSLAGNSYLDFILSALVELPGYIACTYTMDAFGRKKSLCFSYLLTGVACLSFLFIPESSEWGRLAVYLLGKCCATSAFTVLYVYTSELFPTPLRHSFMGTCSTFGRFGAMTSTQTPLLAILWEPLPLVSFGVMSALAAGLTLLFPETWNKKLPDTLEEAKNIGKSQLATSDVEKASKKTQKTHI